MNSTLPVGIQPAFAAIDVNNDGFIDRGEWELAKATLELCGPDVIIHIRDCHL